MSGDVVVPARGVRVTALCCGVWCLQSLVEYADEPGRWWLVCGECGANHRFEDLDRFWECRTACGWVAVPPPPLAKLIGVGG